MVILSVGMFLISLDYSIIPISGRPCLYMSAKSLRNRNCPLCKQEVVSTTPLFSVGSPRGPEHVNIPRRPEAGADPFQYMSFAEVRRSSRHRTANIRLAGKIWILRELRID